MPVSQSRTRRIDARLLLIPAFLGTLLTLFTQVASATYFLGLQRVIDGEFVFIEHPFQITIREVIDTLSLLGVFAILVLRFARTISEQERYATEVEGARSVQQFLIPGDLPQVPGLTIESDYRPAREVGGDFFQIIPDLKDGSALVLVGDVAGKGMQAGMLATLLVGAMRTAATFTRDPAVILSTLNNRLCDKGNATCLALRIEADGRATLVNAGHLPPYLNGVELPMEGALPLGTIPNLDFPVLNFEISPGDTLTLISDGILEAQKPDGELFGFERITELLAHSTTASSLATAAQEFGQVDDITVLTIARLARPNSLLQPQTEFRT
jgi:serine phosphatase RsbU (regulator of sigma subunit)